MMAWRAEWVGWGVTPEQMGLELRGEGTDSVRVGVNVVRDGTTASGDEVGEVRVGLNEGEGRVEVRMGVSTGGRM